MGEEEDRDRVHQYRMAVGLGAMNVAEVLDEEILDLLQDLYRPTVALERALRERDLSTASRVQFILGWFTQAIYDESP